jgi:hypothetical protein
MKAMDIDVTEIKRWLIHGDILKISKDTGFVPEYVGAVLKGRGFNEKILDTAFDMAMERKAKYINKSKRLKDLQ